MTSYILTTLFRGGGGGAQWLSGRALDPGARGPGFEPHNRRIVFLSKTL